MTFNEMVMEELRKICPRVLDEWMAFYYRDEINLDGDFSPEELHIIADVVMKLREKKEAT
jgi:DNA-directed RNA polymerase subunit F